MRRPPSQGFQKRMWRFCGRISHGPKPHQLRCVTISSVDPPPHSPSHHYLSSRPEADWRLGLASVRIRCNCFYVMCLDETGRGSTSPPHTIRGQIWAFAYSHGLIRFCVCMCLSLCYFYSHRKIK